MELKLHSLFSMQGSCIDLKCYQNEYETMRLFFDKMPELARKYCGMLSMQYYQSLEEDETLKFSLKDNDERIKEANCLRHQGNQLFTAKGEQRNVLGACRLYTDAIFAALDTVDSDELSLDFANRAMALQTFGYYQQAYDDCVCALKLGYPIQMRHKIITRQAYCALKLKNIDLIEKHLNELQQQQLNDNFEKQLKELNNAFEELKQEMKEKKSLPIKDPLPLNRESQEIITTTDRGRYMQATCFIEKNQLIFCEKASAFVAIDDSRHVCHQCGSVNFIPIPCLHCRGRIIYCSLKCQEEHSHIHLYECKAYRYELFAQTNKAHIALRMLLDNGLLTILNVFKTNNYKTTREIWSSLTEGGEIWNNTNIPYAESLRLITHLNKMSNMQIEWVSLVSHHLVIYLKNYTDYFEMLNENNNSIDWELLTASLLLRHIGQSLINTQAFTTIIPLPLAFFTKTDFHMLNDNIWSSPWHLKSGFLHSFSYYEDVAEMVFPYHSLCNHSCVQSFQPKFSGRYISAFAVRDLNKGDEITHCYYVDYRKSKSLPRRKKLRKNFYFDCKCENCIQKDGDVTFNQYHQYRCDNIKCRKIFVPNIPNKPTLNWWQSDCPNGPINTNVFCTICGCVQRFEWYHEFKSLFPTIMESDTRRRLYRIFKNLENTLLGLNFARSYVAIKLTRAYFELTYINIPLNKNDYRELLDMIKYTLNTTKSLFCVNSIEYVIQMTFLWDLIVKRKYKCSKAEMDEMLAALNIIADDLKVIFLNYYNDYIKDI